MQHVACQWLLCPNRSSHHAQTQFSLKLLHQLFPIMQTLVHIKNVKLNEENNHAEKFKYLQIPGNKMHFFFSTQSRIGCIHFPVEVYNIATRFIAQLSTIYLFSGYLRRKLQKLTKFTLTFAVLYLLSSINSICSRKKLHHYSHAIHTSLP